MATFRFKKGESVNMYLMEYEGKEIFNAIEIPTIENIVVIY